MKKKIGLALGSGGARGLVHIGVIKGLISNGVEIDMIAGSSVGALMGALFACWKDIQKIEKIARDFGYKEWMSVFMDPNWGRGVIKGEKAETYLRELIQNRRIEDFQISFAAVATDIRTAKSVTLDKGDAALAVRASSSVPLLFEPVIIEGRSLVDGGLSCPVPVEAVKDMGADIVIAVNLDGVYFEPQNQKKEKLSSVEVMVNSLFLLRYHLAEKEVRQSQIIIKPKIPYVHDLSFVGNGDLIDLGEQAVNDQIREIKKLIGEL